LVLLAIGAGGIFTLAGARCSEVKKKKRRRKREKEKKRKRKKRRSYEGEGSKEFFQDPSSCVKLNPRHGPLCYQYSLCSPL
jgi:hypothetical protein